MAELRGWIKLNRSILEWGWYEDPSTRAVFIHLLLTATFRESEYKGHKLHPGDVVVGLKSLAKATHLTIQNVRTALAHLESTGEITRKVTNKFSIVTIENWEKYQGEDDVLTSKLTNNQQTTNKQLTNNQQHLKNVKNKKKKELLLWPNNSNKLEPISDDELFRLELERERRGIDLG